ncbi:MAG TPA: hypothetical protein VGB37_16315 [Candidatus Lokiarchaeia archaeon]
MNYTTEITGGIGKHILATSFIKWLNEKYPKSKLIVVSAYPEIFEYNPRIFRNLRIDQPYLFEDYIKDSDFRTGEVYNLIEYYQEKDKKHLMNLFPKAYGFNKYNENPEMEIYLTKGEEVDGDVYNKQNFPLITFQPFGGLPPGVQYNRMKVDTSERDMPMGLAIKIVQILNLNGFKVLQIRGPSEPMIPNTLQLNLPFRNLLPISKYSLGHIGIDSCFMHTAACFKKPQLIFWGNTHKDNLGYEGEGIFNAYNKYCMKCRPHIQLPDREGLFPFKDKNENLFFKYTDGEIEKYVSQFINFIRLKLGEKSI